MTLDLVDVSTQISAMAAGLQERQHGLWRTLELARAIFAGWSGPDDLADLRALARAAAGERLVAEPVEPLGWQRAAPPAPAGYAVVATDGSQIDLDRHSLAPCYLINVGSAVLAYGGSPQASLTSRARLYYADDDLFSNQGDGRVAVQGSLLDLHRTLAEQERALELMRALRGGPGDAPLLVLIDGTLVLWRFSGRAGERAAPIAQRYLAGLRAFQQAGVPVCSYVSRPSAREILRLLALAGAARRPALPVGASRPRLTKNSLRELSALHDRLLFDRLPPGARSALCASGVPSGDPALGEEGDDQRVHFFYLNVGHEIGRVEVPAWVATAPPLLDLVHALVVEQCRLGWGYPVALSEAHEQAVIRGGEREAFLRMVSSALNDQGAAATLSLKRLSRNRRAV